MNKKLQKDALLAELASVSQLLTNLATNDALGRVSFEARKREIEEAIGDLEDVPDTTASVALIFNGEPVIGSRAIDAEFAARALESYQEIIAKKLATNETGGLAQRGPIPVKKAARLNITNVVHGSFGFLLEEDADGAPQLFNSSLRETADEVTHMIDNLTAQHEGTYWEVVQDMDGRLFTAVRDFFDLMHRDQATLRIVEGTNDKRFAWESIERGHSRVVETTVDDVETNIDGVLIGVVPIGRRFELRSSATGEIISGKVGPLISQDFLERIEKHEELIGKRWIATVRMKTISRLGREPIVNFMLLELNDATS
jgi:hypothetical protein